MTGNNKIILNNATMQEAVKLWLNSQTVVPIANVGWISASNSSHGFTVDLKGIEA